MDEEPAKDEHEDDQVEELDDDSESALEETDSLASSVAADVTLIVQEIEVTDYKINLTALENASTLPIARPDEAFSDPTQPPALTRLGDRVSGVVTATTADDRRLSRASLTAELLGVHFDDQHLNAGDQTLSVVRAQAATNSDTSLTPAGNQAADRIVAQWTKAEPTMWESQAARNQGRLVDRDNLGREMVRMGMVRFASPPDPQGGVVLDSRAVLVPLIVDTIAGQDSNAPVDLGQVFQRGSEQALSLTGAPVPTPLLAEVTRLGLGGLAEVPTQPGAPPPLTVDQQTLADTGRKVEAATQRDTQSLSGTKLDLRKSGDVAVPYDYRNDLSQLWESVLSRTQGSLNAQDAATLEQTIQGAKLHAALAEWSQLRRIQAPQTQLAGAASDLSDALKTTRAGLVNLAKAGGPLAEVAGALLGGYVGPLGSEAAREFSECSRGTPKSIGGQYEGVERSLTAPTDAGRAQKAGRSITVSRVVTTIETDLSKTQPWRVGARWTGELHQAAQEWTTAAKDPLGAGRDKAAKRVLTAVSAARENAARCGWADRRTIEVSLDSTLQAIAGWYDGMAAVADPSQKDTFTEMSAECRSRLTPLKPPADLAKYWEKTSKSVGEKSVKSSTQKARKAFTAAVTDWKAVAWAKAPKPESVRTASAELSDTLDLYRKQLLALAASSGTPAQRDAAAQLLRALDTIASAAGAKLKVLGTRS